LREAAMQLYSERGFQQTTVAEIANRAGLTERTFFRYFADKREVLFAGSELLQDELVSAVSNAPAGVTPIDAVAEALMAAGAFFNEERREYSRRRQALIVANPELQERELIKLAALTTAMAAALRQRNVTEPAASLVAEAGIGVFRVAFERWVDRTNSQTWPELVRESMDELRQAVSR
jgi:AcrR family transcriptional regulator